MVPNDVFTGMAQATRMTIAVACAMVKDRSPSAKVGNFIAGISGRGRQGAIEILEDGVAIEVKGFEHPVPVLIMLPIEVVIQDGRACQMGADVFFVK